MRGAPLGQPTADGPQDSGRSRAILAATTLSLFAWVAASEGLHNFLASLLAIGRRILAGEFG